jgi:signal transduction histidine kinase
MRSLYVKIVLIFLGVSLVGTLLAAFLIRQHTEREFNRLLREQARATFVREVQAFYQATGSLRGIERVLRSRPPRAGGRSLPYALVDSTERVVVPAGEWQQRQAVPQDVLEEGLPVAVEGRRIATVLLLEWAPVRNPFEERYLQGINQALLLGALGATTIAVILGAVLARSLTRPLQEVSAASQAMARGDLDQKVPVRTQDELGELARAFNQMSAALARARQQRRQMTADIAHDLRTPLTVLAGYLEAMEEGALAPTAQRLATMQQEVAGLNRLVEDLRTLSLADAGELPLHVQETDVQELLDRVRDVYAPQARQQEVDLRVEVAPDLPPVRMDPERIRQVLGNLLSNALRHTSAGDSVVLKAAPENASHLLLNVRDTGAGIAAQDLPHVFNRFYRGDKARSEEQGAAGLGLAIARSLVEMHGGTIGVESASGSGTVFRIRLPL